MPARRDLIDLPARMANLAVDERGYPVPKFVKWIDDEQGKSAPDFRVIDENHFAACIKRSACWLCGGRLGVNKVFVVGPMCCVNRISSEPPCHYQCARFAALNCPFLTRPLAVRRSTADLDAKFGPTKVAGIMIERNPGVTALWVTQSYTVVRANGYLFQMGKPERVEFYREGRLASRDEVGHSVDTGLPLLRAMARNEGSKAVDELERMVDDFDLLLDRSV